MFTAQWAKDNGAEVDKQLIEHGAVLFRGFPLSTAKDFDAFVKCFPYQNFHYEGGAAVRTQVMDLAQANRASRLRGLGQDWSNNLVGHFLVKSFICALLLIFLLNTVN